jgi:valyl-tRNA synthetase
MNLEEGLPPGLKEIDVEYLDETDRWILSRLNRTIDQVDHAYNNYKMNEAIRLVYDFTWADFCDWYIEFAKTRFYGDDLEGRAIAQAVAAHVMREILKLLHPYCPFITEELWAHFKTEHEGLLISTPWPVVDSELIQDNIENEIQILMDVISAVRNIRASLNVSPGKEANLTIRGKMEICEALEKHVGYLQRLAKLEEIKMGEKREKPPKSATAVIKGLELFVPLSGIIDLNKEIKRLEKQIQDMEGRLTAVNHKLANKNFVDRAPENIINHERQKQHNYETDLFKLQQNLESLEM